MKKLFALILLTMFIYGCTNSQTMSGSGTATNKPQDSTVTESNNTSG